MFRINEVVNFSDEQYRILTIYLDEIVWILLNDDKAFPSWITKGELIEAIDEGFLTRDSDPFEFLAFEKPDEESTAYKKRNHNFELISSLISDEKIFYPKARAKLINELIANNVSTKRTLYKQLRRYWQRGQIQNALLPDYKLSGGKGKKRQATDKKLGRPRVITSGKGAIITPNVEKLFRRTIEKYLLIAKKNTFPFTHRQFKNIYETYYPGTPEDEMPSLWQMKHFYTREYKQAEIISKQVTSIAYQKDVRPLSSTVNANTLGPGSRFEIDATIADIYVTSNSERACIIGRPVVYTVIDSFSRMVAGIYVGMESPSYATAMQALSNALTDKVAYCAKYGINITNEEWPINGLPDAILADRGELIGHQIESLERNFSIRIENTGPYRGDAKGIVERYFRTLQAIFKPFLPGIVTGTKIKKQGDRDYRLDAKITLNEFIEIILTSVLYHNQFHTLEYYDRDRDIDMPEDLAMTPISLWNWGLQNRTGKLRNASEEAIKIALLPQTDVTCSPLGIKALGIYFTSSEILDQGWLHRGKSVKRPQNLKAAYDPRTANQIYLFPEKNNNKYWICKLSDRSREFIDCTFWEVEKVQLEQKQVISKSKMISDNKLRALESSIAKKVKDIEKNAPNTNQISDADAERLRRINDNKAKAKDAERKETAFHPATNKKDQLADVIPITEQDDDCSFPDHIDELFDED
ncbi:MAG: hypothetical protein ACI88H_003443 [Cocleimonas sp.]|jgi:hypothetical protein